MSNFKCVNLLVNQLQYDMLVKTQSVLRDMMLKIQSVLSIISQIQNISLLMEKGAF